MPAGSAGRQRLRLLLLLAAFALGVRLIFLALTSDTYDYDEFVALLLGRDWAHGAMPYRDFMFFHPPGILVFTRTLEPLFHVWWPSARLLMTLVDTATAALVGALGLRLWGRGGGVIAGLAYGLSPVALISAVRVGQDPIITFLGVLGLYLLVSRSSRWVLAAGVCLGLAVWVKYPAAYFAPLYVLAAPRRSALSLPAAVATFGLLMLPFYADWHAFYQQTVVFQRSRWVMDNGIRLQTTLLYWLVANVVAIPACLLIAREGLQRWRTDGVGTAAPVPDRPRGGAAGEGGQGQEPLSLPACASPTCSFPYSGDLRGGVPLWVPAGFLFGVVFGFNSQVYYHYFVVVAPFGALLTGWLLAQVPLPLRRAALVAGLAVVVGWGVLLQTGGPAPLYVTAAHLSTIEPTIRLLDRSTPPGARVLGDRFEYAYLADRPAVDQYFWNVGVLVGPSFLERRLAGTAAVVLSYGASSGYPPGFVQYLDGRFRRLETPVNSIWLLRGRVPSQ